MTVIRTALTLGKYAPLHHGHDLVIRTAMAETDRVIVMIDCPETTSIPLAMRANWLADLYPESRSSKRAMALATSETRSGSNAGTRNTFSGGSRGGR